MNPSGLTKRGNKKQSFFLIIRQDDLEFLDYNHCAAAVMSVFRNSHKWKLETDARNKKANDVAEQHGDARWLPEDVSISFTIPELLERILHLFGRNAVMEALKLLEEKGVITIHSNPNQKYKYDQGRYFRFHPDAYAKWLRERDQEELYDESELDESEITEDLITEADLSQFQVVESSDGLKSNHAAFKNKLTEPTQFKNKHPSFENKPHIDINKNINNKNKSINRQDYFLKEKKLSADQHEGSCIDIKSIFNALTEKGFPAERFQYPDAVEAVKKLREAGATVDDFIEAYEKTQRSKGTKPFAARYLIKVVESILISKQKPIHSANRCTDHKEENSKSVYENDFRNGLDWMGDLLEGDEQ